MELSKAFAERFAPHPISGRSSRSSSPSGTGFSELLKEEQAAGSPPSIAPLGTPNSQIKPGQLLELGGGVYYNTETRLYQDLQASVVGTNRHAVQQYTDPEGFLQSGVEYQASDAHLRATIPNLDELVGPGVGSPTAILNACWAYDQHFGGPPLNALGEPSYPHQENPVPLMAYQGVLKAPGPPPLAGKVIAPYWGEPGGPDPVENT